MNTEGGVRYRVNDRDRIVFLDEGWDVFACANDGPDLTGANVLGRSLWDFISDATTRRLYETILGRVRRGLPARFPFRCDGTSRRRWLEMAISPLEAGAVEFSTRAVRWEEREPIPLLARKEVRSDELLRSCAWCNRVHVEREWEEVETAVQRLRLFELSRLPQLTHGICGPCLQNLMGTASQVNPDA